MSHEGRVIREGVTATLFGRAVDEFSLTKKSEVDAVIGLIEEYSRLMPVDRIYWLIPEINLRRLQNRYRCEHSNYFSPPTQGSRVVREGPCSAACITKPNIGIAMLARANPLLVLTHKKDELVYMLNCKLDSLHGIDHDNPRRSVVDDVMQKLPHRWLADEGRGMTATLLLGTAPQHYNLRHRGVEFLGPILHRLWGINVVPDTERETVDLQELVITQLREKGLRDMVVERSTIDVNDDQRFASSGKGVGHNLVIVHHAAHN